MEKISLYYLLITIMFCATGCSDRKEGIGTNASENRTVFFIDSNRGNDSNDGLSPQSAWKTLGKVSRKVLLPGDTVLLCKGCTFYETLRLHGGGTEEHPIIVSAYDSGNGITNPPVIDAKGYFAAVQIENGTNIEISNLELTANGGTPLEPQADIARYGVFISATNPGKYPNLRLKKLKIHHIFATENVESNGQNSTSNMGMGIGVTMKGTNAIIENVHIEDCTIEMTGHTGIQISGKSPASLMDGVTIINNRLIHIGGPGIVTLRCQNVLVCENVIDHCGSSADPRMHARGSGIWPGISNDVLIEKNEIMHARGKNDACGVHIDANCKNVVVQYNLSLDNEGGFVEILGNNHNCAYRYNVSINDGFRIKGVNKAQNDGKIIWTTGIGGGDTRGPFNSYIYNNTIFVKEGGRSCFSFTGTTEGILIANNIFHLLGETLYIQEEAVGTIQNVVFTNNLYPHAAVLPEDFPINDNNPYIGDPEFINPGGDDPQDYIPVNSMLVKDKGVRIEKLPGDEIGLTIGLEVDLDYFGHPIKNLADIGAIEIQ